MIRPFRDEDTEEVVRVWLEASIEAHGFIPRAFWEAAAEDMRTLYLPMSDEIVLHVDAVASLSNYLRRNGWKKGMTVTQQTRVLRSYNAMDIYAHTILALAKTIRQQK